MKTQLAIFSLVALLSTSCTRAGGPLFVDRPPELLEPAIEVVSDHIIAAKWVNRVLQNPASDLRSDMITVTSADDPAFRKGVHASRFSYWVRPTRYSLRSLINVKSTYVFVYLDQPLQAGHTYTVSVAGTNFITLSRATGEPVAGGEGPLPSITFAYRGDDHRSTAVHVNQLGYLPQRAKISYLTQYAGAEGAVKGKSVDIDFAEVTSFRVVDAVSGETRWEGKPALSKVCVNAEGQPIPDRLSQSRVWDLDFSSFQEPGRYRVVVPGVGASLPFSISPKIYNQAFGVLMRGAYHQRCGTALTEEWTRHVHPACHLDDARIPNLAEYGKKDLKFFPQNEGGTLSCPSGHHDAGDYGKYTTSGALFPFFMLLPFEVMPEKLQFDASPLPENSNGIPDILDEVKWELDWVSNMMDPADGGVFTIVKPHPVMDYEDSVPGKPTEKFAGPRSLWWKDLPATASYAAILARAARTPAMQKLYPDECRTYLEKSKKAWDFCMKNTDAEGNPINVVGGHHYGAYGGATDDYCWASVELWLTTGEAKYHEYFLKHFDPKTAWNWGWWPLVQSAGAATRAYAYGTRTDKDPAMLKACLDEKYGVLNAARSTMSWQQKWATRVSFSEAPWNFNNWGWYYLSDISSYDLALAATLVPDPERESFLQAACFNADQEFGNSADDVVSITGIGVKRPVDHVHQISRFSGLVEPVPGIPLGFHPAGYNRGNNWRPIMTSFMVNELPAAYRYVDCWNVAQEFTVQVLGPTIMTYAMMADPAAQKPGRPELRVTANGSAGAITGSAPFRVDFRVEAKGVNGKAIRDTYWDLSNEETASDASFAYTFTVPGLYPVVCSATDEDGWMAYQTVLVCVAQPEAERPNEGKPHTVTTNTYALWHFDTGLADEVSGLNAELTGQARLSAMNLLWMDQPAGQAVQLRDEGDGILIHLPDRLINDPAFQSVRIEALVNYEKSLDWSKAGALLLMEANYDTKLGLHQVRWTGKSLYGVSEAERKNPATEKLWRAVAEPHPGWMNWALGYDRATGKSYLESGYGRVEFTYTPGPSKNENLLKIGGFVGYLDEVRILTVK